MVWCVASMAAGDQTRDTAGSFQVSEAEQDESGFLIHTVRSEFQAQATQIKVLLPDRLQQSKRYGVLYVLPVEAGDGRRWGDALGEVNKHNLHNKHELICVFPTFSHLPWYADHPSDPAIRQERYFLEVVVPFVEANYPALEQRQGRLLVGFSKSGWGAFSLLLRHPDLFGKAAAWDAPLMEQSPKRFGMGPIFGSEENFRRYQISELLTRRGAELGSEPRLILSGYDNFREDHVRARELLIDLDVAHVYRDGPKRKHHWESGWLPEAVGILASP